MSIKIEINPNDCQINTRSANGKTFYEQRAYLHTGSAYPMPFKLSLRSEAEAYPSGEYTLHPDSFQTNQYGNLELNRYNLQLVKVKPVSAASTKSA